VPVDEPDQEILDVEEEVFSAPAEVEIVSETIADAPIVDAEAVVAADSFIEEVAEEIVEEPAARSVTGTRKRKSAGPRPAKTKSARTAKPRARKTAKSA
jgi:hypothetical protein